jgi:TolB-like protein/Tfp pilus assembly protein PilF
MAKSPEDRPASADEMARELRSIAGLSDSNAPVLAHALTRVVVLPFRVLRPDPETDFLAFSLADAIASSLSALSSVVVRSSAVAARFARETPDLKVLASDADVDRVVIGALLRAGDQLRASVQLVQAPDGTLLASHTVQSSMGDLFGLQDFISGRMADALSPPLAGTAATPAPARDAPANARAYELYLRANELSRTYEGLARARDVYEQCLELDPEFAPAWAHVGRCYRVIGKYVDGSEDSESRAETAFQRALALNPALAIAHKFYANLEADMGRTERALSRLLRQAALHRNDPELFAGLVHACRYTGLFDHSVAAHSEARRLDPNVPTGLEQTLLVAGDIEQILQIQPPALIAGADDGIVVIGLGLAGRLDEARQRLKAMRQPSRIPAFQMWIDYLQAWLDRRSEEMIERSSAFNALKIRDDPEAIFQEGWLLCDAGAHDEGLPFLRRAIDRGYYAVQTLGTRPQFDLLRERSDFQAIVASAESGRQRALAAFRDAGGERLFGM